MAWSIQFASCFYMVGVIAVIQLIHYPSFSAIEESKFIQFHTKHSNALSLVAGPAMCAELISALWIARNGNPWLILNFTIVILLWFITFFVSVPLHQDLASGYKESKGNRLTMTNWIRTTLWSLRGLAFLFLLTQSLQTDF